MTARARLVLLCAAAWACRERAPVRPPATSRAALPLAVTPLPPRVARGVSYAHDWSARGTQGYGSASDRAQLDRLRALGATWVSVTPFGYLRSLEEAEVHAAYERPGSETDAALTATIREAHARGLRVLLKPHLWVRGSWPGAVDPRDPARAAALVQSWGRITSHYAELAARERVEALTVGVEMDPLAVRAPQAWRAVIADARARYRGTLTYAANWSSAAEISFWEALDVVAVNHYAPLADAPGVCAPDVAATRARASLAAYAAVGRRCGRPVWLTEVGFRRDARALTEPWTWSRHEPVCEGDLQSAGYAATFRAVAEEPAVEAVFLWKWFTSGGEEEEGATGFVFAGRPAEAVVRGAFRAP